MEFVTLNNGVIMPKLGFGVYQTASAETEKAVSEALKRDTASSIRLRLTEMKKVSVMPCVRAASAGKSYSSRRNYGSRTMAMMRP